MKYSVISNGDYFGCAARLTQIEASCNVEALAIVAFDGEFLFDNGKVSPAPDGEVYKFYEGEIEEYLNDIGFDVPKNVNDLSTYDKREIEHLAFAKMDGGPTFTIFNDKGELIFDVNKGLVS